MSHSVFFFLFNIYNNTDYLYGGYILKPTKKQHYISQYTLKRFLNSNGQIDAVLLKPSLKRITCSIKDICTEKDFYEDKDRNGNYINRNHTENKFAKIESDLAGYLEHILGILEEKDRDQKLKKWSKLENSKH